MRLEAMSSKTKYREIKDNNNKTGRGRKSCKFYKELDKILGHRPASVPTVLLDTGDTHLELEAESEEEVNGKEMNNYDVEYTCIPLRLLNCVDGTQVQPNSPLDSAVIIEGNEPEHDGNDDGNDDGCNDDGKNLRTKAGHIL